MKDQRQLDLFADGAQAIAAAKRPKPPQPTEADLQAKLDAARMRLLGLAVFGMKTWSRWRRSIGCAMPSNGAAGRSRCTSKC
jgi:hypothetical protein